MEIFKDTIILIFCIGVICKGATWLVDSASKIAKQLGISELVVGLTIVAFGTSAPEFGVTIFAAIRGASNISVGNIIGSNIFNLGIILGGAAIIQNLSTIGLKLRRDGFFLMLGSVLTAAMLWDLELTKIEGFILFVLLFVYLGYLYQRRDTTTVIPIKREKIKIYDIYHLIAGFSMLFFGSHFLVSSATNLAHILGISQWIIGATIIAAGTSLPEFATSVIAVVRGHHGISIGNLIGSDIFNVFGALGLAAILRDLPVEITARPSLIIYPVMVIAAWLVGVIASWRSKVLLDFLTND